MGLLFVNDDIILLSCEVLPIVGLEYIDILHIKKLSYCTKSKNIRTFAKMD